MKSISALILFLLGTGFIARKYTGWIRLLLIGVIGVIVLYATWAA
ncbi:MAG TPA: hypothetical protein VFV38_45235 [Ktedonobacteraceae bacterium]|nr:hypothetical protein [Ktedonobacteraceae bacterium]